MNKLYDNDGELIGYEHNGKYLMKIWNWGSGYSWAIRDEASNVYWNYELEELIETGRYIPVSSFKEGKDLLLSY